MKLGKPSGMGRSGSGKGRSWLVMALVLVGLVSFSCGRPAAPPPPPPPEVEPAPPPPPPAATITISASPATITAGDSTTLQWSAQNSNGVTIEPGIGPVAANGTMSVDPNASVTYTATATGPGGDDTANVRVTVNQPPPPPPPPAPAPEPTIDELFRQNVVEILFDYDRSEIRQDQVASLQGNARFLQQNAGVEFLIGGHADERGTQEYNIGLGDERANTVRQFLEDQGVAASRINIISYGEERPVCSVANDGCWQRNRRAEFSIR